MGLFSKKDKNIYSEYEKNISEDANTLADEGIVPVGRRGNINHSPYALTADEVKGEAPMTDTDDIPMQSASESLYERMISARKNTSDETDKKSQEVKKQTESLLSRCTHFVADDGEKPILSNQPAYTLDSVEDIIAEAEKRAQARVKKIYGDESLAEPLPDEPKNTQPAETENPTPRNTEEIMMTRVDVKNYQYRYADEDRSSEDFVTERLTPPEPEKEDEIITETAEEATISFTPVSEKTTETASEATMPFIPVSDETMPFSTDEIKENIGLDIGEKIPFSAQEEPSDEELFGDYETVADAEPIHKELKAQVKKINLKLIFTALLAIILTALEVAGLTVGNANSELGTAPVIVSTVLTAIAAAINYKIFGAFAAFFGKRKSADTALCISICLSLVYGTVCIANGTTAAQFGFISVIGMMFSLWGKRNGAKRRLIGFEEIANDQEKYALTLIDEAHGSYAIAHDAVEGEALIAAGKKTINITHYLKNSASEDNFSGKATVLSVIGLVAAVAMTVWALIAKDGTDALATLTAFCAVCAPFSSALIGTRPSLLASKRLMEYGAMITGAEAAEIIEQANAAVFDVNGIFPRGRVKMYDMKVLSPNDLDKTIFNAAAVTTSINSPLGHVFRRIARTSDDYVLPPADSVKYEKRMGISGWVGDHSLLIGNRTLMETHGVSVPSVEVDKKILRSGYFPVYVASDGSPCALLIVGYEADRDIENELRRLQNAGVVLLINNCDPNVTEEMLCDYFGLQSDFVKIMQSGSVREYREKTEFRESVSAPASFQGNACGLAAIITASIRMKRLGTLMAALHIIMLIIGIAGAAALAVSGFGSLITPVNIAVYLAASLIFVFLPSILYRP